ncbi:MAG TPA: ABC transporter permease [Polyangia bacterium]
MAVFEFDRFAEIVQTLRRNRLRTFLTACGIFWGVFMLVMMLGFGRGLEKAAEVDMGFWVINNLGFRGETTSKPYEGRQSGRRINLTLEDIEAIRRVPGVEHAWGRNHMWGSKVTRGDKSMQAGVNGDYPEAFLAEGSFARSGRLLNPSDMRESRKIAIIGTRVQDLLFVPGEDPIGQWVEIFGAMFQVVGVLDASLAGGGGGRAEWLGSRIFIPRSTLARVQSVGNRVGSIQVLVTNERPSIEIENDIKDLLRRRHHVAPDDERGIQAFNRDKQYKKFINLFAAIRALSWIVGVMTLIAGAIGVSNIMMIAVAERTREIGIRKAIGEPPGSIMGQIVAEATVLTGIAGYLGLVFGVVVLEISGHIVKAMPATGNGPQFFSAPELDLDKAIAATILLTVAGAVAGLAPARAAVAVRPVEALAHE